MNQLYYYAGLFVLSFLMTLVYIFKWKKQFQVHMTAIFIIIPTANLAYGLMYAAHMPETAMSMLKIIYISGCFLPWLLTMCELRLCRIEAGVFVRVATFLLSSVVFLSVQTVGYLPLYYRSLTMERAGSVWIMHKEYGPVHLLHYACMILYMATDLIAIIYAYRKKRQVSRQMLFLLFLPVLVSMLGYCANHSLMKLGYEAMPLTYVMAQLVYLQIMRRMAYYNVSEMVIESMVQSGETGFITVDSKGRYLGSNETAKQILPQLSLLTVDQPIRREESMRDTVADWLDRFEKNPRDGRMLYTKYEADDSEEERIYKVSVSYLYDGKKQCGYQIFMEDDTGNQQYIRLLDRYNADLQAEVAAKTGRIMAIHDRFILGMATMVESRDNSTGGHIRRTSKVVRILVETIQEDGTMKLTDEFCKNIIKAAPMHDLGKIAVDDAILRKPGRFTPEEFEKMKAHAAEGARIVHEILQDTEDEAFCVIAENVAHYHHERMDGSGYPEGLKGEEIPLEARIMAVADVYDALVSRRVYKERFSFEKADQIILEGMGTQFDARLQKYYEAARPRLEAYYAAE